MGDSDIEREVDQILDNMQNPAQKQLVTEKPKLAKPRKKRGPPSDAQKKALASGRARRQEEVEIRRLEKEQKRGEAAKKLAKLKKEKAVRDTSDDMKVENN